MDELQLILQLFSDLRMRSKLQMGIDRDVFVKFCPIPGLWGLRIFNHIKYYSAGEAQISFEEFVSALRKFTSYFDSNDFCFLGYLSRSSDNEIDGHIFQMFDLQDSKLISLEEMTMMLNNFPDIGFSNSQNINVPDIHYQNIKDSFIRSV